MKTTACLLASCFVCAGMSPRVYGQIKPMATLEGHGSGVTGMAFHPDGIRMASVSFRDAFIWDRTTGKEMANLKRSRGYAAAFTPDGRQLAIGGHGAVTIHDATTGRQLSSFDPHGNWKRGASFAPRVHAMSYSPDGKWLATAARIAKVGGSHGYPGGAVKVFDVSTGMLVQDCGEFSSSVVAVSFSADGKYLAAGSCGAGGEVPASGEFRVWNAATFELLFAHTGDDPQQDLVGNRWSATGVAFSPDSTQVAAASNDRVIRVWDLPSGRERQTLRGHTRWVECVAFSSRGDELVSAGGDGVVRVWDARTGAQLRNVAFQADGVSNLVSNPNDRLLSWTGTLVFSPDRRWLGAGGRDFKGPGEARVWQLSTAN